MKSYIGLLTPKLCADGPECISRPKIDLILLKNGPKSINYYMFLLQLF